MEYTFTLSETEIHDMIFCNTFSVFDLPFEIRSQDLDMYLAELKKAEHDREYLDSVIDRIQEDIPKISNPEIVRELRRCLSYVLPGGKKEFAPELEKLEKQISQGKRSVFDLYFNFRIKYSYLYEAELLRVRGSRKKLNKFLKKAKKDLERLSDEENKKMLESRLAPYLPGGKREFYPEFGQLCDRGKKRE